MKKCFFSSLVIVVIFMMAVLSCDKDNGNSDGNGDENGNGNGGGNGGVLTIKGLPAEYNDKYVTILGYKEDSDGFINDFSGYERADGNVTHLVKISGGEAKIPMWRLNTSNFSFSSYTGNDKGVKIVVEIWVRASLSGTIAHPNPDNIRRRTINGVDFTNGNATAEWGAEPEGFVGVWEKNNTGMGPSIEFNENGTWNITYLWSVNYRGTYTSSGKTAQMTITSAHWGGDEFVGVTGAATITLNKLTLSGFADVERNGEKFMNGEYYFVEH